MAPTAPANLRPDPADVPSGLEGVDRLRWGSHVCHLYRSADDLASTLVPYFAAGLRNDERCLWITAEPLGATDAWHALARAVPDLEARARQGQIDIVDHDAWCAQDGRPTAELALARWLGEEAAALRGGWRGLRVTGNASWLRREDWAAFEAYERRVHQAFAERRIVAVCSYSLARCTPDEILDVVRHHGFALARRGGDWTAIRSATETLDAVVDGCPADHDAIVYRDGEYPAARVGAFLADGVRRGEGVVVVVGGERARAVRRVLAAEGIAVDGLLRSGQLVWLDPEETLPQLLQDGVIDPALFAARVPPLMTQLRARFGRARACGEMVDLLSRRGDFQGALALERLWNGLLRELPITVLCTYRAEPLQAAAPGDEPLAEVRREHRHLHPVRPTPPGDAFRELVAELAEKTRALEAEATRRSALEGERDSWRSASRDALSHVARLQRVTSSLLGARSPEDLSAVVVSTMAEVTGASSALLAAVAPGGDLEVLARSGAAARGDGAGLFAAAAGSPIAEVARDGRLALLPSPASIAERWPGAARGEVAALVAVPLQAGQVGGVLAFGFSRPQSFSRADQALFDDLARQAALALDRARLVADLERARTTAEEASRAKDEFLAMLGHELRNPLSPMLTVLHLMARRAPDAFRHERGILERQLRHMEHLVNDLLDVSRIVRGKLVLRPERIALGQVVGNALEAVSPLLESRRHRVSVEVPSSGLEVDGDLQRLVQAVVNLVTNAARYTPSGGHVAIRAEAAGERALLRVEDDGQGIAPAFAARIFDLFVQGPRGIARTEGGLGLGLAITRSIVEMHGGTIQVESAGEGKGSTFTVALPLAAGTAPRLAVPPAGPERAAAQAGRVLVVDDNEDAAETLADVLRCSGYQVRTAHDADAALAEAAQFLPDVAVLDIGLPAMDGWTLGARLREQHPERPPHCLAVTGYGMEGDHARTRGAGFVAHLVKPVDLERLERVIAGLVAAGGEGDGPGLA